MSQQAPAGPPSPPSEEPGVRPGTVVEPDETATQHAPGAWHGLMLALGRDLSHGMARAEKARRRMSRMR